MILFNNNSNNKICIIKSKINNNMEEMNFLIKFKEHNKILLKIF
jgi:hypothetical protein